MFGTFKEQTKIALKRLIKKTSWLRRRNINEQVMLILVQKDTTTTKRGLFQQKNSRSNQSCSKQFWNPIANVSVKVEYEKNFSLKPDQQINRAYSNSRGNCFHQHSEENEKCIQFPSFMSEQHLSTRSN